MGSNLLYLLQSAKIDVQAALPAGLMGHNFLYLLEAAKKNVLQPGCAVVPCAASLYVMGINIETQTVGGYNLSGLNKYRSVKEPTLQARISTPTPVV